MKFTKMTAAALSVPEGKLEHFEWDPELPGFGIRLRKGTNRVSSAWVVQYRLGPQQRRESLGDVRKVNLEDARKIARQRFAQVELGVDPAAEKQKRAQAAATQLTLAAVTDRYLDAKRGALRSSTYKAAENYFAVHWKPLRSKPVHEIRRTDIAARLQDLVKAHGRTSAARARDYLRAMFSWAMKEGLCEHLDSNPVAATNDPAEGIEARDRVLGDDEIRAIWKACQEDDFGRIVRLLLLTGCRREEIAGLLWNEVNFDTGVMTIPGTKTKNHKTLELPLPGLALGILQSAPRRPGRDHVFGFRGGAYSAFSYSTLALNSRIVEAEGKALAPWRLHDLRRTMRTGLGKLGVEPHVAELAINHVRKGVEAIYDRHKYQPEIRDALALWADYISAVADGTERKIIPLRA
jgi:integrase